ncbi:MAG: hypothetical protein HOE86_12615, partial [Gemmatimonadetes bacterium]|nr:hypothetical protein [Gemmatimonadota bacterium]
MERTINRARKITGQVRVPGELPAALKAVWLAAISTGDSLIEHAPPSLLPHLAQLKSLGVAVGENEAGLVISGVGLRGFTATSEPVDLRGLGVEALLPVTLLAMQATSRTIHIDASLADTIQALFALLAQTGAVGKLLSESQVQVDGVETAVAVDYAPADLDADTKLALLCAGLYAEAGSVTTVRQAATSK